jgi:hypothetical protein
MSFIKRLALFILILAAIILFFGLFPVIARTPVSNNTVSEVPICYNYIRL